MNIIWGGGFYAVILAMASSPYLWSGQDEKDPDCVMRLSNIVGVVCIGKNIANCSKNPQFLPVMCAVPPVRALCRHTPFVQFRTWALVPDTHQFPNVGKTMISVDLGEGSM